MKNLRFVVSSTLGGGFVDEMYEKRIQEMLDLGPGQMEVFRSVLRIRDRFSALDKGKQVEFRKAFDGIFDALGKE